MWWPDLKARIHSRWELLYYLKGVALREERRREDADIDEVIRHQAAEARANLNR